MAGKGVTTPSEAEVDELRREVASLRAQVAALQSGALASAGADIARLLEGFDQLPVLLHRVGNDGRFLYVTGKGMQRVGLDAASMIGRPVLDVFPEARGEVTASLEGSAVRSEASGEFEGRPWAALSYVVPVASGGTVGVSLDITDWKAARRELTASELRFRSLAETVAVAITRNDLQGFILYANQPMARLLGVDAADLVGHNSLEFAIEEDRERIASEWIAALDSGTLFSGVFRVRGADGRPVWVLSRSVVERDETGKPTGYVSSLVDINERKQLEEELAMRVEERTAMLTEANRDLESFCYSVSHDLRAPLRSIDGFCRLLADDLGAAISTASRDSLDRVLAATRKMDRLIDDFLTLSRASLGSLRRANVDLSALALHVADEVARRDPSRRVKFEVEGGLVARGDAGLLEHVLENLFGNAFKFTASRPDARIGFGRTTTAGGETAFFVHDNGVGFDAKDAPRLFAPFRRLHADREFEGTGVGLATVDRIVRRHGGRVWAESEPGQGAWFYFTLPAR